MPPTSQLLASQAYRTSTLSAHSLAVERVIHAMHAHVSAPLSLDEMAEMAYLSPFHFDRVFRSITSVPPGQFLAALRLDAAKRLLLTTSLSVTDVCFELGYASLGTFTQRFKQLVGLPPLQLRQLAEELSPAPLDSLRNGRRQTQAPGAAHDRGVSGTITAPAGFAGPIFVGLFPRPVPQGRPVACTTLASPGPYQLAAVRDGRYFLRAAGLSWSQSALTCLLPGAGLLVGVAERPVLVSGGQASAPVDLALRPPHAADPPILGVFPPLLVSASVSERPFVMRKMGEAYRSMAS